MITRSLPAERRAARALVLVGVLLAVLVALIATAGTARGGGLLISIDPGEVPLDSNVAKFGDCPGVESGLLQWGFRLDGVSPGLTSALTLNVTFQNDGAMAVTSTWDVTGATHTFLAYTTGQDVLQSASVVVPNTAGELHIVTLCRGVDPTPAGSLQDAAVAPTDTWSPVIVFFGVLLLALGAVATLRIMTSRPS